MRSARLRLLLQRLQHGSQDGGDSHGAGVGQGDPLGRDVAGPPRPRREVTGRLRPRGRFLGRDGDKKIKRQLYGRTSRDSRATKCMLPHPHGRLQYSHLSTRRCCCHLQELINSRTQGIQLEQERERNSLLN